MKHSLIDKYSYLNSPIHKLSPFSKTAFSFIFVISIVLSEVKDFYKFFLYFFIILVVIIISKIPILFLLKRCLYILPFIFFTSLFLPFLPDKGGASIKIFSFSFKLENHWQLIFINILVKAILSFLTINVLINTTKFHTIMKALERLWVPKILTTIMNFIYNYIFITIDEAMRIQRARNIRTVGHNLKRNLKVFGNIIGVLFIRSYERSERVFFAMCLRGFDGNIRVLNEEKISFIEIFILYVFSIYLIIFALFL